jgi:5-hydroxyisourate hydrolase-like protein (transthyretin family)
VQVPRRSHGRVLGIVAVALLGAMTLFVPTVAHAAGTFIPAPNRHDIVYDDARSVLYISSGDRVLRYDVVGDAFLSPWVLGGDLRGMDLSSDGSTLAVADATYSGDAYSYPPGPTDTNHVYLVDTASGTSQVVTFQREYGEAGTWRAAYQSDGRLFVTSRFNGSGGTPLRRYDPATGQVSTIVDVNVPADLCASGDRNVIAFAEGNISDGRWGSYRIGPGAPVLSRWSTGGFNRAVAANRDGTEFAVFSGGSQVKFYDASGSQRPGVALWSPIGPAYSPTNDVLYVAGSSQIVALDARDFTERATYGFETSFEWTDALSPHIWVSRGDTIIAAPVTGGVRFILRWPEVEGVARSSFAGMPVTGAVVELWRDEGGTWSVEATVPTDPQGAWSYSTTDTSPVRVRVSDPSGVHEPAWHGGADLASAANVTPVVEGSFSADVVMTLAHGGSIAGTVRSAATGGPIGGVEVALARVVHSSPADPPLATTFTAGDGTFRFDGLCTWRYRCAFTDPSGYYVDARSSADIVVDAPATTTADQTMVFVPARVQGAVTSSYRGVPVPNAEIELWREGSSEWELADTTVADADGCWSYSTDSTSPVRIRMSDPSGMHDEAWYTTTASGDDPASVVPARGATVPNADVQMSLTHPGGVCGYVFDGFSVTPVPGARLVLYHASGGDIQVATAIAGSDGSFHMDGLGPGSYHLGSTCRSTTSGSGRLPRRPTSSSTLPGRVRGWSSSIGTPLSTGCGSHPPRTARGRRTY